MELMMDMLRDAWSPRLNHDWVDRQMSYVTDTPKDLWY